MRCLCFFRGTKPISPLRYLVVAGAILILITALPLGAQTGVRIYMTWNIKGQVDYSLSDTTRDGNLPRFASLYSLYSKDTGAILLDMGNTYFPATLSRFSYGSVMNEMMNSMGYDLKRLTTRDFLLGYSTLENLGSKSLYPMISTNMAMRDSSEGVFTPRYETRSEGKTLVFFALENRDPTGSPYGDEHVEIRNEIETIREQLNAVEKTDSVITLCLCDNSLLETSPELLSLPLDYIICGMPEASPNKGQRIRVSMSTGLQVLYVPRFTEGIGVLHIDSLRGDHSHKGAYFTPSLDTVQPDTGFLETAVSLINRWERIYRDELNDTVAIMDSTIKAKQKEVVGNLLREWAHTELACFEQSLVTDAVLPDTITVRDLDRLLATAPDLLRIKLSGNALKKASRQKELFWAGVEKGKVGRRSIAGDETYSVVITEYAWEVLKEGIGDRARSVRPHYTMASVLKALRHQLAARNNRDYSFNRLERRWRLTGSPEAAFSRRDVNVGNPDSIRSVSGANDEPFSAWDMKLKLTLSTYNPWNHISLTSVFSYASANEQVGNNQMDYMLDYRFEPSFKVSPYLSTRYQSYLIPEQDRESPVRTVATAGASAQIGTWSIKVGAGTQKSIQANRENPFTPFLDLFSDTTEKWNPTLELRVSGSADLGKYFQRWNPDVFDNRKLEFRVDWENYVSRYKESAKGETKLSFDLFTELLPAVALKTGVDNIFVYLFEQNNYLYNIEPSLSLTGTYLFSTAF